MLSLHRWQSSPRAVVDIRFLFLFQIREIGVVVGRIGGYNRGESVQDDADLKTAVASENLWDDYGIFFFFFFRRYVLGPFFARLRTGDRQSTASVLLARVEQKRARMIAKIIIGIIVKCSKPLTTWAAHIPLYTVTKKKSTSYRRCLFYFSKKNLGILVEFLFFEQR